MTLAHARVSRLVTWLTGTLAIVVVVAPTLLYGIYVKASVSARLDELLRAQAVLLEEEINRQPDFWEVNSDRLQASFEAHVLPHQSYRVESLNAGEVFANAPGLAWPVLVRSRPLHAFGHPVGNLEGGLSIRREGVIGLSLFGISLVMAMIIWGPLRRIPLTALRTAEEALLERDRYQRALLDNFPFMAWLSDGEDRLLAANAQLASHLGHRDDGKLRGQTLGQLLTADQATALAECERRLRQDGHPAHCEAQVSVNGQTRWFEVGVAQVELASGERNGTVGFARDITTRKENEEELARYRLNLEEQVKKRTEELELSRDAAEAGSRAKSEFLASMSHELRTPLNAILGFSQLLLLETGLSAETRDHAQEVKQAGEHMLALVNDLLELARIEAGRLEMDVESVPLKALLANCLAMVTPMARGKGITLDVEAGMDETLTVRADAVRLKQTLLNLLTNAVKYNHAGGSVRLSCLQRGSRIRILVADTGPGIPPEKQARIFNAFDRLGREAHAEAGSGIGLVITRRIVEAMGGGIGFDSAEGQGSTFWVEFPTG